ncbi:MAG: hypothetical protein IKT72_02320 [Clostridia bacterium]|nr:hypothetical protein [Clostridia bacterium]
MNPPLLLILFLYGRYVKKFEKDPKNIGKTPKGPVRWFFGLYFKVLGFVLALLIVFSVGETVSELF